jgi:hypothetical protein
LPISGGSEASFEPREALSDHPADSRYSLVNVRSVRANPETEAKPIAAVIAMHVDASKLCLDFARARRPERKEISVLCIGAKRSDQVSEAQSLDVNSLDPFEEARHQGLRMQVDVLGGDVLAGHPIENGGKPV